MKSGPKPESPAQSTVESQSTARPSPRAYQWAVHWVYPRAEVLSLAQGDCKIGRGDECRAVLADSAISRVHAVLCVSGLSCRIVDLESRNGLSVDGTRVTEASLHDGSVLRLGGTVGVVVHSPDAAHGFATLPLPGERRLLGSGKLKRVITQARELGALRNPVYIHGESGSGKEAIAELLHRESQRTGDFIALNCSALRGELSSTALFGHSQGAFSGAKRESKGAARAAAGGTLFLDEIGELSPETQPLLLRFLENGEITPVGESKPLLLDVRVVSATHADLFALCRAQKFRADLYHRLTTHELRLPPLRERREDVLGLFQTFAERPLGGLSAGFVEALLQRPFPGNVRELANLAARLKISGRSDELWHAHLIAAESGDAADLSASPQAIDWGALHRQYGGVASRIAKATGVPVSTVKRQLKKLGLRG